MGRFKISLLTAFLVLSQVGHAAVSRSIVADVTEGITSTQNFLKNGSFEIGRFGASVTGGTLASVSSAGNVARGDKSISWTPSATGQILTLDAKVLPSGLGVFNGYGTCRVKTAATDLLAQLYDGTNVLSEFAVTPGTSFIPVSSSVPFTGGTTVKFRLKSQSASAITYVDECQVSAAPNIAQISQATLYGTIKTTGCNAVQENASVGFADSTTTPTGCTYTVTGGVSAPSTMQHLGARLQNAPPGKYVFVYTGQYGKGNSSSYTPFFRFSDGTNHASEEAAVFLGLANTLTVSEFSGSITYSSSITDATVRIQAKGDGSNAGIWYGTTPSPGFIKVYRFPTSAEEVLSVETINRFGNARWTGGTGKIATVTASSWTTFSDADFATRTNIGSAADPASTSDLAVKFTNLNAGKYMVIASGPFRMEVPNANASQCGFRISDGTNFRGYAVASAPSIGGNTGQDGLSSLIGVFDYSAFQSSVTYSVQANVLNNTPTCYADFGTTDKGFEMSLIPLDQVLPLPAFVGGPLIVHVTVSGSTPVITSQGDQTWVTSLTDNGAGDTTLNLDSSKWSAIIGCTLGRIEGASDGLIAFGAAVTTSAVRVITRSSAGSAQDNQSFYVNCFGKR